MRIRLVDLARDVTVPFYGADHGIATGSCPRCAAPELRVAGGNLRKSADDRAYESDGVALCCSARVGVIRAEPDTLFGVAEDEAVLHGRARVYG